MVIFNGGHGAYIAPVAKAIYESYFKDMILQKDPAYSFNIIPMIKLFSEFSRINKNDVEIMYKVGRRRLVCTMIR